MPFLGVWGIGLATRKCDLNRLPLGNNDESWVLRSDGSISHNGEVAHQLKVVPDEGDVIVSFDSSFIPSPAARSALPGY